MARHQCSRDEPTNVPFIAAKRALVVLFPYFPHTPVSTCRSPALSGATSWVPHLSVLQFDRRQRARWGTALQIGVLRSTQQCSLGEPARPPHHAQCPRRVSHCMAYMQLESVDGRVNAKGTLQCRNQIVPLSVTRFIAGYRPPKCLIIAHIAVISVSAISLSSRASGRDEIYNYIALSLFLSRLWAAGLTSRVWYPLRARLSVTSKSFVITT